MKRWLLAACALFIACIFGLYAAFVIWNHVTATSGADIDHMLRSNVPVGSTAGAAIQFLDGKGITHGDVERAAPNSTLIDAGISPETKIIGGILRNTSHGFLYNVDIEFWLILDKDERVVDYYVNEIYDGL